MSTTINCTGIVNDSSILHGELSPVQDLNKVYSKLHSSNVKRKTSLPKKENANSKNIQSPKYGSNNCNKSFHLTSSTQQAIGIKDGSARGGSSGSNPR